MKHMSEIDEYNLDTRLLRLLVAVVEAGSITGAATQLGVTQSAVSHLLGRLRAIAGDPLFVKSGRGIVATVRAGELAAQARELLADMEAFARGDRFEPTRWRITFTIAANDFQRDVLLPALAARLRALAPGVSLRIIPSDVPTLEMLRSGGCHLVISPRPPEGGDVMQKRLFEDRWRVYYDPAAREAPQGRRDYLAADHVTVVYEPRRMLAVDEALADAGVQRRFAVTVPGFAGLPAFLRGSPLLATAPARLGQGLLREFASVAPPVPCPPLPMYMVWHRRFHEDAAHRWMRALVEEGVPSRPRS
ncbi:DNA-binding transcriptional regulator, LysR family [Variovorax sp. YR216]|nr:DNA-binding transcriptional regulator, LysR family [Variovorax sp. YR216]